MSVKDVPRVIYAPFKALKEIAQNPRYIGPLIVLILFLIANIGFGYVLLSKSYIDQTVPQLASLDQWTENTTYWSSNGVVTLNGQDYASGKYYGTNSIEFDLNGSDISAQLSIPTSVNCSGPEGYKSLSFRTKWTDPQTNPSNVSLYLNTTTQQDAFYQDITSQMNQTGIWNNLTIALGQESTGWQSIGSSDWSNVIGLELEFTWPPDSNITLLIDGLFFHGLYKSGLEVAGFSSLFINFDYPYSMLNAFMQFTIQWVILGGLLYLVPKMFGVKTTWKPLLIVAGFIMMVYFIRLAVFAGVHAASPTIQYPLAFLGGVEGEWQNASVQAFQPVSAYYQALWYIDKVAWVWTGALCAIALRLMFELSWIKSILASVSVCALYLILMLFLAPAPPLLL